MKNVVLKNITNKADDLAKKWNDTKDPKYKDQWYATVKKAAEHAPKEEMGYRINFKRKS